ncbi:class I SAM-dependent methyltransferase [Methylomonas sp. LL1]|uniref:class I SAM-dependent methyltransferase n=1 Tax=Methylomonas sp. LL1 TaxID=2785785 RepID=UPI0018C3C6DB|nr:class I SAM-dependent methyltransferase [Methylomonas sp. LL1]QPK62395.1 class I SAM-dependent methyltransferase [Methylomonas sp. LL1]
MIELQAKWDAIYSGHQPEFNVADVLSNNRHLLPNHGAALDLACGSGGNALFLAEHGLHVDALDISPVALACLQDQAGQRQLSVTTRQGFITPDSLDQDHYDVIVISRFLDRSLCNAIMSALKSEGLLFYQTFTRDKLDQHGPSNPDYLLERNELLDLFSPLTLVYYQENAGIGDLRHGNRNEACFIGHNIDPVSK